MKSPIATIVWKEAREIRRDPITVAVAVFLPLLMLALFGSALSFDVKDASLAVYDLDGSSASRALVEAFPRSGYFKRVHDIRAEAEIAQLLDRGDARLVLVIPPGFSRDLARGTTAQVQTLADGSFASIAMIMVGYAEAIIQTYSMTIAGERLAQHGGASLPDIRVDSRVWFNAQLRSVNTIVPGLFAVILMAFPPLLTALAVVRERESGSVQQIFVSPIRPWEFIAGKMLPYAGIAFLEMLMILGAGLWWFGIPFAGSLPLFLAATTLYVFCTVGMGLLVSSITRSQLVAMLVSLLATLMPSFLFSGFLFPLFMMPLKMRLYSWLFPARHFVEISRGIVMKNVGLDVLWPQFTALAVYTLIVFAATVFLFRKKVA